MLVERLQQFAGLKGHPFVIPVITFLALFFLSIVLVIGTGGTTVGADDTRIVHVSVNGETQTVPTRAPTVGELLTRLEIELYENDIVEPAPETPIYDDDFTVNVYRARPVSVIDEDGTKITVLSAHREPRVIAETAGLKLYNEDRVELTRSDDPLKDNLIGHKVVIERSVPVHINLYGVPIEHRTHAKTVGEVLAEKNIQSIDGDTVDPSPDTPITENMLIFVVPLGKEIVNEEVEIPAPIEEVEDTQLEYGRTEVREAGRPGRKVITYEVPAEGSEQTERRILQEVVIVEPVKRVVAKGTKALLAADLSGSKIDWMTAVGISPDEYPYVDYILSRESGWCPTKWQGQYGVCPDYYQELYSPSSGRGYGLCQSTPAIKMASEGDDWQVNPVTQLRWCTNYARNRYGSWQAAYEFWVVNHWW